MTLISFPMVLLLPGGPNFVPPPRPGTGWNLTLLLYFVEDEGMAGGEVEVAMVVVEMVVVAVVVVVVGLVLSLIVVFFV